MKKGIAIVSVVVMCGVIAWALCTIPDTKETTDLFYDNYDRGKVEKLWATEINELTVKELDYLIGFCMGHTGDSLSSTRLNQGQWNNAWLNWVQIYQNENIQRLLLEGKDGNK